MKKKYFSEEERREAKNKRRRVFPPPEWKEKYINRETGTGCWEWLGCKWDSGYGYVRHQGKHISAHRYIYSLHYGPIPNNLDACHKCDNPSCVNPNHIFLGTASDNLKDCYSKGRRSQKGTNNGNYRHGKYINEDIN